MKATAKEQKRAEKFLKSKNVALSDINSFRFMQRYLPVPDKHSRLNLHGSGILTLRLASGEERAVIVHTRNHPTSLIRTLLSAGIPFANLKPKPTGTETTGVTPDGTPGKEYKRPSLIMFWHFIVYMVSFLMAFYLLGSNLPAGAAWFSLPAFALSIYCIYLLQTRFCYLILTEEGMDVRSIGRSLHYPYDELLKVNFDFAREQNFTHVMELMDNAYRYRLFYIGRVSRKSLNEIAGRLCQKGVDATCSLNDEKRHYEDVYHNM